MSKKNLSEEKLSDCMGKTTKFDFVITKNYKKDKSYTILKPFKSSIVDRIMDVFVKR